MTEVKTIHAITADRTYVVRYDRVRKWYAEGRDGKRQITIAEAVELATRRGSRVYLDQPGGSVFDAGVRTMILERVR